MSNLKRKTIFLDQDNINRVIQMFNLKTEKDAVNKALQIVADENVIINMHKEIAGSCPDMKGFFE